VGFQLTPLRPLVSLVVVVNIAEEQVLGGFMNYYADIPANPDRPKIGVFALLQLVKLHPRVSWV